MKVRIILLLMLVIPFIGKAHHEEEAMRPWVAGTVVTERDVAAYGIDKCFVAEEISDAVFARMWNKSYKTKCTVPRSELRYLRVLHRDNKGRILLGEMVCNQAIANDLVEIFRELYKAAYPIERMVLIDEYDADDERSMEQNNSSCFNYRTVAGTSRLSNHARGMAVDINTLYNPYYRPRANRPALVQPTNGRPYLNRKRKFPYKIVKGDLCYRLFIQHGFTWGGSWRNSKDYQHFEKNNK